jgi:hypothetical protein
MEQIRVENRTEQYRAKGGQRRSRAQTDQCKAEIEQSTDGAEQRQSREETGYFAKAETGKRRS